MNYGGEPVGTGSVGQFKATGDPQKP